MSTSSFSALSQQLAKSRSIVTKKHDDSCETLSLHTVSISAPSPPSSPTLASPPNSNEQGIPPLEFPMRHTLSSALAPPQSRPTPIPIKSVGTVREMYRNMRKDADNLSMQKHRRSVTKLRCSLDSLEKVTKPMIMESSPMFEDCCNILETSAEDGDKCIYRLDYGQYCVDAAYKQETLQLAKQYLRDGHAVKLFANFDDTSVSDDIQASHDARQVLKAVFYAVQSVTCHDMMPAIVMKDNVLHVVLAPIK